MRSVPSRAPDTSQQANRRARLGLWLLLCNTPVGWMSMALFGAIAAATSIEAFYGLAAAGYALSWAMLVAGLGLAGPEGGRRLRRLMDRIGSPRLAPSPGGGVASDPARA